MAGEEADDMRMLVEREGFINDASQLPMFKVHFFFFFITLKPRVE